MNFMQLSEHFDSPIQPWRLLLDDDVHPVNEEFEMSEEVESLCAAIDQELADHKHAGTGQGIVQGAPLLALSAHAMKPGQTTNGSEAA